MSFDVFFCRHIQLACIGVTDELVCSDSWERNPTCQVTLAVCTGAVRQGHARHPGWSTARRIPICQIRAQDSVDGTHWLHPLCCGCSSDGFWLLQSECCLQPTFGLHSFLLYFQRIAGTRTHLNDDIGTVYKSYLWHLHCTHAYAFL